MPIISLVGNLATIELTDKVRRACVRVCVSVCINVCLGGGGTVQADLLLLYLKSKLLVGSRYWHIMPIINYFSYR